MPKSSIADRYLKNTKNPYAYSLEEGDKFPIREWINTGNYALNTQISGDPHKGIPTGKIIQFAGPQSTGKSFITIEILKNFQAAGYTVFYFDTEGDQNRDNLLERGIKEENFIHAPVRMVSELHTDLLNLLEDAGMNEKAVVVIDSLGNLVSNKELEDSMGGVDKADMTRAKKLKSLFRTITMPAAAKNVTIIVINHVYADISGGMYAGNVVGGGSGSLYSSSVIIELSKSQIKDKAGADGVVIGSAARCKSIKNRFAKEKTVIKLAIDFQYGLDKYSGLFPIAQAAGLIVPGTKEEKKKDGTVTTKLVKGKFRPKGFDQNFKEKELDRNSEVWDNLLENGLTDFLKSRFAYQSAVGDALGDDDLSESVDDLENDILEENNEN